MYRAAGFLLIFLLSEYDSRPRFGKGDEKKQENTKQIVRTSPFVFFFFCTVHIQLMLRPTATQSKALGR